MKKTLIILCLMLLSISFEALAQSPGGVHGTEAWFITESKTDSLNGQYHWADYSGDSVRLIMKRNSEFSEFTLPRSDLRTFNFNPAIKVSHYDFFKSFNLTNSDLSQFTIIGAYAPYAENNSGILYSIKSATGTNTTICGESILGDDFSIPYNNDVYGNLNLSSDNTTKEKENALKILSHYHAEQPNKSLWGNSRTATVSIGILDTISDNNTETLRTSNQSYQGYFPEFAIYSRNLTPFERNRVVSYLALKYGISLSHSYFLSDSTLIWDITSDSEYNNRITAVVNDSKSGLYQPLSTTSFEEYPYYSWLDNDTVDSYYLNNSMSAPSKHRLLVQGKEYANTIEDKKHYIWGDNNQSTDLSDSSLMLKRNWLIKTNIPDSAHSSNTNVWNGNGISILNKGYKNYLIQDLPQLVTAVTEKLTTGDGAISFTYERLSGTIDVGFVSDASATQCNKTYRFTLSGRVFLMENGKRTKTVYENTSFDKLPVKVIKSGRNLILQIDGVGVYSTIIESSSDNYYGFVSMLYNSSKGLFSMNDVRVDGVYDNGNQLELGYIFDDNDLHPSKNNAYLIIDRSGSGNFDDEDLEYIKPSRYDSQRNKLLFNNIYWDTDGNGSDVFSFGCVNCLYAETTAEAATVTDMQPNNDGKINIDIKAGTPAFIYRLRAAENPDSIIREGYFFMDSVCIEGLYPGEYKLDITQLGGHDIYGISSDNNQDRYICGDTIVNNGEINWVYSGEKDDGNYIVGFGTNNSVDYGIRVTDNNSIYAVYPNGETNIGVITEPQILSVSYLSSNGSMSYIIGNTVEHRVYGVSGNFQSIIEPLNGNCQIYNFHTPATLSLNKSVGMYSDYYGMCTITKDITITSTDYTPTYSVKSKLASIEDVVDISSNLKVYPKESIERSFVADLYLDQPEPASLVVFDAAGKLIHSSEFAGVGNIRSLDFEVPMAGVYVVKAITNTQEFTQKIISK